MTNPVTSGTIKLSYQRKEGISNPKILEESMTNLEILEKKNLSSRNIGRKMLNPVILRTYDTPSPPSAEREFVSCCGNKVTIDVMTFEDAQIRFLIL